ncbi:LOW QUALITY PROTEIN: sterol regulatory element-binding protein cleavage-activating protein [Centruroides vittatus]|uniref:LOW QUALITY PROTEIN: sterol regulatory element-binding protein cleavage-activating protein n=1 Tax=Centruroides vittatus TaxID=120091 RepID=UPI00350FE55E
MSRENTGMRVRTLPVSVPDRVAQIYYRHGVFCASHPYAIMLLTILILAVCCYPVIYLPLLGSSSQEFSTPVQNFASMNINGDDNFPDQGPRWFQGPPVGFVQQIVIKSIVTPWKPGLILTDAFRGPLAEGFHVLEMIRNHQTDNGKQTSLSDICLQVSEPVDKSFQGLPQYSCLIVSPAHIWMQDINRFQQDSDIIKTIFKSSGDISDSSNLRDILFGVPWKETGIKKLNMRTRPRIITYAITVILKKFNIDFMQSLYKTLQSKYSFPPYPENVTYNPNESYISHVQFQDQYTMAEFVPLGVTYIILFLYIYFSVCKIEMVKSKWALAMSAVFTVLMSLLMSVGLCLWFGLHPTLNGSEILPYLIVIIGLENMLVLTKSVVSTPDHLDTKVRLAQGLSKEGWSITKNLFTELALLTFAFFTFVPAIQEFCLFAVVGLLSDFFLQLVFFTTVLSIDIGRTEVTDYHRDGHHIKLFNSKQSHIYNKYSSVRGNTLESSAIHKAKFGSTHLKSPFVSQQNSYPINQANGKTPILVKLPKRLKFVYFWARTRIVQRGLMICLVFWIFLLLYKSGIVGHLADNTTRLGPTLSEQVAPLFFTLTGSSIKSKGSDLNTERNEEEGDHTSPMKFWLYHHNLIWQSLPSSYWSMLFRCYNISLSGSYISMLPTIHLSIPVDPDIALKLRHPAEVYYKSKDNQKFSDSSEFDDPPVLDIPYHPSSPAEVALAIALSIPSIIFIVYVMVLLYRCMCSRHYAEWRSSWSHQKLNNSAREEYTCSESDSYFISETFPIKLQGHSYEIENFVAEENIVASSCLGGDICIWDALSGECVKIIKRAKRSNKQENENFVHRSRSVSSGSNNCLSVSVECESNIPNNQTSESVSNNKYRISLTSQSCSEFELRNKNRSGYDFSKYCKCLDVKKDVNLNVEKDVDKNSNLNKSNDINVGHLTENEPRRYLNTKYSSLKYQPVWCMDCKQDRLVLGCSEGRLEVWDTNSGQLQAVYEDNDSGITSVYLIENRIIAARLNGILEFFVLNNSEYHNEELFKKINGVSTPVVSSTQNTKFKCCLSSSIHAHTQPIVRLVVGGGHVITGSQDHLVKVFRYESLVCIYTLHGHSGGVTALHMDQNPTSSAASGCQDGMICVWDLLTGTCVYSLAAHRGAVRTLLTTYMYVISYGLDDCMCIWEKCQGHLLHTIHQPYSICHNVVLLTNNVIVTAKEDHLVLWDVNHGETLQMISLGSYEQGAFVKRLKLAGRALVCDYGSQLFVIHFPAIREKGE